MSKVNHYMRKDAIMRGIVTGEPGRALCGETFLPTSQGGEAVPGSEAASVKARMCEKCESIFDSLRTEKAAEKDRVPSPNRELSSIGGVL